MHELMKNYFRLAIQSRSLIQEGWNWPAQSLSNSKAILLIDSLIGVTTFLTLFRNFKAATKAGIGCS